MALSGEKNTRRLILGTVQFGLDYGISNERGQIAQQEVNAILAEAKQAGIPALDTAAAYGESEASIGSFNRESDHSFQIISKYPPNRPELPVAEAFQESLRKLGVDRLHAYLLHNFASYSSNPDIINELQELKRAGKVDNIGISLYHPEEASTLLEKQVQLDVVQFPYSVFDRRFEKVLPLLRQKGIETHVRSVYLQGLFFMDPDKLPASLQTVASKIAGLQQLSKDHQLPLSAVLLGFVLSNPDITNIVIGVESLETLQENISYCHTGISQQLLQELQPYQEDNEEIILPFKWKSK